MPERVTVILGPQPAPSDSMLAVWGRAADAIRQYRDKYDIAHEEVVLLGPAPNPGAFQQRYDRRQAAAVVLDALDQLDRPGFHRGNLIDELDRSDLGDRELAHRRDDVGWEP